MPYERKGKCIYNKETGDKKGCSSTVGKAKAYMRALYAAEKGNIKEESSKKTQAILDRAEDIYQAMKATAGKSAVKRYGADAEDVLRGRAMNIAKKQVKMGNEEKLKEIIKKKLSTPPSKKMEEGKVGKFLTGAALFAALMAGDRMITNADPRMAKLKSAYEKAEAKDDKEAMKKIKDMIAKQEIFLSSGQGEPQDIDEKKAKPDFLDLDGDGDKEESMKKAAKDKKSIKEETDYEGEMAKSELYRIIENAEELFQMLDDDTQLEGWVQSKITKAADYLNSVTQYLKYQSVKPGMTDERLDYTLDK
jgi:hypothetical protein